MTVRPADSPSPTAGVPRLGAVSGEGQTTIPADYLRSIGLKAGDVVAFELDGDRIVLRKAAPLPDRA